MVSNPQLESDLHGWVPTRTADTAQTATLVRTAKPCPPGASAAAGTGNFAPGSRPGAGGAPLITCPQAAGAVSLAQPSPAPGARRSRTPGRPSPSPSRRGQPAATPSAGAGPPAADQVLAAINHARAKAGLPPYTMTSALGQSAAAHTGAMAAGCGLSHQCPGEPPLGARETAAGAVWTAAGENIGEGGPEPASPAAIAQLAVTLTQDMLNEQPPNDGHRLNILSKTFHHIGISVIRDSHGTVWMTQDFAS